jgi:hypothetical protein
MKTWMRGGILLTLLSASAAAWAEPGKNATDRWLERLERWGHALGDALSVRPRKQPPAWVARDGAPILRFAQIADVHFHGDDRAHLDLAVAFLNDGLRPAFVVFTGDNASCGPARNVEVLGTLKAILDAGLRMPYFMVKGDNDARGYEQVFGSSNWAFSAGGMRFVGIGLDQDAEGSGVGFSTQHDWVLEQIRVRPDRPAALFVHESILPPTFLDAFRLGPKLAREPNLVLVAAGHLHKDVELRWNRITHITCPSLLKTPGSGIKLYEAHADHLTVKTFEVKEGTYAFADKWQRVPFPRGVRLPAGAEPAIAERTEAPPAPTEFWVMPDGTTNLEDWLRRTARRWEERRRERK